MLAAHLGDMHGSAHAAELHQARLTQPLPHAGAATCCRLPGQARQRRGPRTAGRKRVPATRGSPFTRAQRLIAGRGRPGRVLQGRQPAELPHHPGRAPGHHRLRRPHPRPVRLRPRQAHRHPRHDPRPARRRQIAAALTPTTPLPHGTAEALAGVTWDELMNWAEIHHILTSRYAADGRYPCRWDQVRPDPAPEGAAHGRDHHLILTRHGEAHCNVAGIAGGDRACTGLTERGRHQVRNCSPNGCAPRIRATCCTRHPGGGSRSQRRSCPARSDCQSTSSRD